MRIKTLLLSLIFMMSVLVGTCAAEQKVDIAVFSGTARVIDGDTIAIDGHKIRLSHVDAPELKQTCESMHTDVLYACGEKSRDALQELLYGHNVTCHIEKRDIFKRLLGECFIFGLNINEYLIITGNAILYRNDKAYLAQQIEAQHNMIGIWASSFVEPWVWRKEEQIKAKVVNAARASKAKH